MKIVEVDFMWEWVTGIWEWLTKMKSEIDLLDAVAGILVLLLTVFGFWRNSRKNDKNNIRGCPR